MPSDRRPLLELTDHELRQAAIEAGRGRDYSFGDYIAEFDRRVALRQARAQFALAVVSTLIAVAAVLVAVLKT